VLGDVCGKGPAAALLAAEIQGILAAHASSTIAPSEALTRANQVLARRLIEGRFATISYSVVQPGGYLVHCNAGHNPPILLGATGLRRLERGGPILGAFERASFEEEAIRLEPGDLLVVFTDGITDALSAGEEEFGEERLVSCVEANRTLTPSALLECLVAAVETFGRDAEQNDDRTLLVMRYTGTEAP
jgi:phosphoserine phosphatase RsbU/P